jgi:hypothetical protein
MIQSQKIGNKRSEKPPKLPPRDNLYPQVMKVSLSQMKQILIVEIEKGFESKIMSLLMTL